MSTHSVYEFGGKFHVLVEHNTHLYIFRYAYPSQYEADKVCSNLSGNFGGRGTIDNDLRINYWPYSRMTAYLYAAPNENGNWYLWPEEGQPRSQLPDTTTIDMSTEELIDALHKKLVKDADDPILLHPEVWDQFADIAKMFDETLKKLPKDS